MFERCRLFDELKKIKTLQVYKSASNFILFRCEYAEELYQYSLEKSGILLKLFKDAPLENCIRLTVGLPKENVEFLRTLNSFLKLKGA